MGKLTLPTVAPPGTVFRIARGPDPWRPPDWAYAHDDRTFGNRFDDSEGYFRVLYAGSTRRVCFLETLARYRAAPIARGLLPIANEIQNTTFDYTSPTTVPASWLANRMIGSAKLTRIDYADIYSSEWLSHVRRNFEAELLTLNTASTMPEFDLALLLSQERALTQKIATLVYKEGYAGIHYQSRHGSDVFNWALFEPFEIEPIAISRIRPDDIDFQQALTLLNLRFNPTI